MALLPLPNSFEEYLRERKKQALRTNRKLALAHGFYFNQFTPMEHLEEILDINRSMPMRQGRPMDKSYTDKHELASSLKGVRTMFEVFNTEDRLRAYAYVPICGEVGVISRLLGHADSMDDGVMYLLVSEVIRHLIERKQTQGSPRWVMYDTFFGASPGLRYFKERLGFKPYRVKWVWCSECSKK